MKKGFTLIELLAVIVILAIIALIAVPIILNIISDTKEKAFEQSINGIVKSANVKSTMELKSEEILYKYENNKWVENKLNIDGEIPKYIEIKENKKGQVRYAITDGKYCATKEYDSKINIKKIGNENNDKKVEEQYCKLDALIPTDKSCFKYNESNNEITITGYYCYEGNDKGLPVIKDLIIPKSINGKSVTKIGMNAFAERELASVVISNNVTYIGIQAFQKNKLTDVIIPNSVIDIRDGAFMQNDLTSIKIPDNIKTIGEYAFKHNQLTNIEIPSSVTYIEPGAFAGNQMPYDKAFIYNRKNDGSINYSSLNSYAGKNRENVIIPNNVEYIGESALFGLDIKQVVIPEEIKTIGDLSFANNLLNRITIPDRVTRIGDFAFSYNKLTSVTIKGKSSVSDFGYYGVDIFSWKDGYSDEDIIWEGSN